MVDFRSMGPALAFPQTVLLPLVALGLLIRECLHTADVDLTAAAGLLVFGLAVWTLAEYLLHRFILHRIEPFRHWHLEHHWHPEVPMRTPLLFSLMLVLGLAGAPPLLWASRGQAVVFSGGLILGHLAHELVHYQLHRAECSRKGWLGERWRYHDFHHHGHEGLAFGTLSSVWDSLFGTRPGARVMPDR